MPDGTGRFYKPSGGGGMPGLSAFSGGGNLVTRDQADAEAAVKRRLQMLQRDVPAMSAYEDQMISLATGSLSDHDMMMSALDAVGATTVQMMISDIEELPWEEAQAKVNNMNAPLRDALLEAGLQLPDSKPQEGPGFLGSLFGGLDPSRGANRISEMLGGPHIPNAGDVNAKVTGALGSAFSKVPGVGAAVNVAQSGLSKGLSALNYPMQEVNRLHRMNQTMSSGHSLLEQTGMTEEQMKAQTGIDAHAASSNLMGRVGPGSMSAWATGGLTALSMLSRPQDLAAAVRTWNAIGHNGEDDILPEVQYRAYEMLDEFRPGQAKDLLRYARAIAQGADFATIAEDEGLSGNEALNLTSQLSGLRATAEFNEAVSVLSMGKISMGRTLARSLGPGGRGTNVNPFVDTSRGYNQFISGTADAVWSIGMDPLQVAGPLIKAQRAANWGVSVAANVEGAAFFDQAALSAKAYFLSTADDVADDVVEEAIADAAKYYGQYMKATPDGPQLVESAINREAILKKGKAFHDMAQEISDAFVSGDFHQLTVRHPNLIRNIDDMQRFDRTLKAEGLAGMDDPGNVFEFYKLVAGERNILGSLASPPTVEVGAQTLFGHDPKVLFIPHMTTTQRARAALRETMSGWKLDKADEVITAAAPTLDDAGEVIDDVDDKIVAELLDDPALKDLADEAEETLAALDEAAPEPRFFDVHLNYVRGRNRALQKQLVTFYRTVTSKVPRHGYLELGTTARTQGGELLNRAGVIEEYGAFNTLMGLMSKDSDMLIKQRMNRFVNGTLADRHVLVNEAIQKLFHLSGEMATPEGREIYEKFIVHRNQFYGIGEDTTRSMGQTSMLIRQAVNTGQLSSAISVPDARQVLIATRKLNAMRQLTGGVRASTVEAAMSKVWKPGQLLRLSYPIRATADETLQYMARVGARYWVRGGVLEKWAGVYDASGEALREPKGFVNPMQNLARGLSHMFNVTDEGLAERASVLAAQTSREFVQASMQGRAAEAEALLAPFKKEARANLRRLPKSVRWIDEAAHDFALTRTQKYHDLLGGSPRKKLAEFVLEQFPDAAERIEVARLMMTDPRAQQARAAAIHATIADVRPDRVGTQIGGAFEPDPGSTTGWKYVKLRTNQKEWVAYAHNDPTGFMQHYDHNLRTLHDSPSGRAGFGAYTYHVSQPVIDDIGRLSAYSGLEDTAQPLEHLSAMRDKIFAEADALTDGNVGMLEWAARHVNSGKHEQGEGLSQLLAESGLSTGEEELFIAEDVLDLFKQFDGLSADTRRKLTDPKFNDDFFTTDLNLVKERSVNAINRVINRLDGSSDLRSSIRATQVGGVNPILSPPPGTTPIYMPMIDRRSAPDVVAMFSDTARMEEVAKRLSQRLGDENMASELKHLWGPMSPSASGWDLPTVMAAQKASLAQSGSSMIPPVFAGSSDPRIAMILRDTFAEVFPEQVMKPTIGVFYQPDNMLDGTGISRVSGSIVHVEPTKAEKLMVIDPAKMTTLTGVRLKDGKQLWLTDEELPQFASGRARARVLNVEKRKISSLSRYERAKGEVSVNAKAAQHELVADPDRKAPFLRGEGGFVGYSRQMYGWADETEADAIRETVENLGPYDFETLVNRWKHRRNQPVPLQDVMEDTYLEDGTQLWAAFERVARSARRTEATVVDGQFDRATADASRIVKAALDDLGVDVEDLAQGLTVKQYVRLLGAREQALAVLRPAGMRPARMVSKEAVALEADAMAFALNEIGYRTGTMAPPFSVGKLDKDDYEILGKIIDSGVTEAAAVRRTAQDIHAQVEQMALGAKTGEVLQDIVTPLQRGEYNRDLLVDHFTDLPQNSYGPAPVTGADSTWAKVNDRFHKGTADPIINGLGRSPMFLDGVQAGLTQNRAVLGNLRATGETTEAAQRILARFGVSTDDFEQANKFLVNEIRYNKEFVLDEDDHVARYVQAVLKGDNPDEAIDALSYMSDLTDNLATGELEILKNWHQTEAYAYKIWTERAYTRATELIAPYIDDYRIRSIFQEYIGPVVMPYWYAEEQFLRRFSRGVAENPAMIRKMQLLWNGMRNSGVITEDAHGNSIFVLPGSELLTSTIANVASLVTGNEAYQSWGGNPLSMRAEFILPGWNLSQSRFGWGPLIGLSTEGLLRRFPELQPQGHFERDLTSYLVPGPLAGAYRAFVEDPDPTQVNSATMAAIATLEAAGRGLPENASPAEKERYWEDVRQSTRVIGMMRYGMGMLTFTSAVPVDPAALYRQEFLDMLQEGMEYEDALVRFLQEHDDPDNPDDDAAFLAYTVFASENEVGAPLPATEDAWGWMRENDQLLLNYPEAAAWFIPETDQPFDSRAYNEQLALELRRKRSPEEVWAAMHEKQAASEYYDKRDTYKAQRRNAKDNKDDKTVALLDDKWSAFSKAYKNQHPVFAESFGPDGHNRRTAVLEDLKWMTDPSYDGITGDMGPLLRPLVERYHAFQTDYAAYEGQSSKVARRIREELAEDFFTFGWLYVQQNPRAKAFWSSVVRPEMPDAADEFEARLTNA